MWLALTIWGVLSVILGVVAVLWPAAAVGSPTAVLWLLNAVVAFWAAAWWRRKNGG